MYLRVCVELVISLSLYVVGLQWFCSKGWGCSRVAVSEINDGALSFPLSVSVLFAVHQFWGQLSGCPY